MTITTNRLQFHLLGDRHFDIKRQVQHARLSGWCHCGCAGVGAEAQLKNGGDVNPGALPVMDGIKKISRGQFQ